MKRHLKFKFGQSKKKKNVSDYYRNQKRKNFDLHRRHFEKKDQFIFAKKKQLQLKSEYGNDIFLDFNLYFCYTREINILSKLLC